jgi:hypothetical protein
MESQSSLKVPEKFIAVIRDFLLDLSTTFPEYTYLWSTYEDPTKITELYQYCLSVYPERFFDILYQNDSIFEPESEINTLFLPNVEFKMLFAVPDISENTKKTMWKYLQLILMTIMDGIKEKSAFGQTADLFQGIDETELQTKLYDTVEELSNFFTKGFGAGFGAGFGETDHNEEGKQDDEEEAPNLVPPEEGTMPSGDDLHNHLKGLFDGKIGSLAKELADELSGDLMEEFGDLNTESSTSDIFKNIMKDPSKLMGLMKKVSSKLDDKMKSGDISQDDIMKELGSLMGGLKGMSGGADMKKILKTLMKKLGPMLGGMKGMENTGNIEEMIEKMMGAFTGGAGGAAGINKAKMGQMSSMEKHKERMRAKLEKKRAEAQAVAEAQAQAQAEAQAEAEAEKKVTEGIHIEKSENAEQFIFKIDGDEGQEKSSIKPPNDDWLDEPIQQKSVVSKGKKGKKGKK